MLKQTAALKFKLLGLIKIPWVASLINTAFRQYKEHSDAPFAL